MLEKNSDGIPCFSEHDINMTAMSNLCTLDKLFRMANMTDGSSFLKKNILAIYYLLENDYCIC